MNLLLEKLKQIEALLESVVKGKFDFNIKDVERIGVDEHSRITKVVIIEEYYKDEAGKATIEKWINAYIKDVNTVLSMIGNPYYWYEDVISRFSDSVAGKLYEMTDDYNDWFPHILYISGGSKSVHDAIGIVIEKNGDIEIFEGNNEASGETHKLVNRLVSGDKMVKVWAMHTLDLVDQIQETGIIPKGIFVSPNKHYSEGYWNLEKERALFSGEVLAADFSQDGLDWKALADTPIKKLRIY